MGVVVMLVGVVGLLVGLATIVSFNGTLKTLSAMVLMTHPLTDCSSLSSLSSRLFFLRHST